MEKLNDKKVRNFLSEINEVEFRYLELTLQLASSIQNLIKRHNISKEKFCELFKINAKVYDKYTKGNFKYSLHDMAVLNSVYQKLEAELAMKLDIIKVGE